MARTDWPRQFDRAPWSGRWRSPPAPLCPSWESLTLFAREPLAIPQESYSHIVRGCPACRLRLRELLLRPH